MIPANLLYTKSHEWTKIDGDTATVGITQFAQEQLGDLTFVDLPKAGDQVTAGAEMGSVESVKAASELYSPVTGEVVAVNEDLASAPEKINQDPYGAGWMIQVKLSAQPQGLLDAAAYEQVVAASAH
ncbi:MAG TPA: glycine cleavage system protein GcvH [Desulfovibrio sp.]|nr:glycine cleavage system protein GcvH [Desulfovibrio sp.]HBR06547.1 glycine cleavage system protein GcvH [Desulfovibrio sp.]